MIIRQMLNNSAEWEKELWYSFVFHESYKVGSRQFDEGVWKPISYLKDRMLSSPKEWTEFIYNDEVTDETIY